MGTASKPPQADMSYAPVLHFVLSFSSRIDMSVDHDL